MIITETNSTPRVMSKHNSIVIDSDDKIYLLCLQFTDDEFHKEWYQFEHADFVYDTIKENIDDIDLSESFVLDSNMKLKNSISVYEYIKMYQKVYDEEDIIDLEQYSSINEDSNIEVDDNFRSNYNSNNTTLYISNMLNGNNNRSINI